MLNALYFAGKIILNMIYITVFSVCLVASVYAGLHLIYKDNNPILIKIKRILASKRFFAFKESALEFANYLGITFQNYPKSRVEQYKFWVVNLLPTKHFLILARFFSIGHWLEYEDQEPERGRNSLITALYDEDFDTVDKILKYASPKAINKYATEKTVKLKEMALYLVVRKFPNNIAYFKKMMDAISSENRLKIYLTESKSKRTFFNTLLLTNNPLPYIELLMSSLQKEERLILSEHLGLKSNNTSLLSLIYHQKSLEIIQCVLKYLPTERLFEYLKCINASEYTALMYCADSEDGRYMEYILGLIPPDKMAEFLRFHDQGLKAMIIAVARNHKESQAVLAKYGVVLPEHLKNINAEKLNEYNKRWVVEGRFRKKFNEYPDVVLGINKFETNLDTIRKAYFNKMRATHPDRNKGQNANNETKNLMAAHKYYCKLIAGISSSHSYLPLHKKEKEKCLILHMERNNSDQGRLMKVRNR